MNDPAALKQLMVASMAGDGVATRQLLSALAPRLRAFFRAKGASVSDAEDLVQECLISIHTKRHLYDPGQPLMGWVLAIGRYRLIDYWRKNGRRGSHVAIEDLDYDLPGEQEADVTANLDISRLFGRLPDKQRKILDLVKIKEHSLQEAADMLGYSLPDVKISVHRALKSLQSLISVQGGAK